MGFTKKTKKLKNGEDRKLSLKLFQFSCILATKLFNFYFITF